MRASCGTRRIPPAAAAEVVADVGVAAEVVIWDEVEAVVAVVGEEAAVVVGGRNSFPPSLVADPSRLLCMRGAQST